ncbi:MAG TPA: Gfo/Idh/MocA family oxidoreductase [Verrucomicrobiae bacterium]|nr:Gfo/Idh/MocA family oxidoreductase [Verrucomicrobiae bacterium]
MNGINQPINVAVVGLGFMGVTHLRAYLENPLARVAAVCGTNRLPVNGVLPGVAGNIKKSDDIYLGADVKVFRRFEELLADPEIDLIDICTPTPLHPEQVILALKAGKHVVCEKPLARTSAAAREVLEVRRQSPGILFPAMCMRFWPGWSWLKKVVAEQTYGKNFAAHFFRFSERPGWSAAGSYTGKVDHGGALFDLHIHDTDFALHLFGKPASVFSNGVLNAEGTVEHVVTQYQYPGGPAVSAQGSWLLTSGFNMGYQLHCERATIEFNLANGANALQVMERNREPEIISTTGPDGYSAEINYALECIAANRAPEIVTAADAVAALEICEAEDASLRTGQVVPVPI